MGTTNAGVWQFTLHTTNDDGFELGAHAAFIAFINALWLGSGGSNPGIQTLIPLTVKAVRVETWARPPGFPQSFGHLGTNINLPGTNPNQILNYGVCATAQMRGAMASHRDRGTMHFPPYSVNESIQGALQSTAVLVTSNALVLAMRGLITSGYLPCLYDPRTDARTPIKSVLVKATWSWIGSRARGLSSPGTYTVL